MIGDCNRVANRAQVHKKELKQERIEFNRETLKERATWYFCKICHISEQSSDSDRDMLRAEKVLNELALDPRGVMVEERERLFAYIITVGDCKLDHLNKGDRSTSDRNLSDSSDFNDRGSSNCDFNDRGSSNCDSSDRGSSNCDSSDRGSSDCDSSDHGSSDCDSGSVECPDKGVANRPMIESLYADTWGTAYIAACLDQLQDILKERSNFDETSVLNLWPGSTEVAFEEIKKIFSMFRNDEIDVELSSHGVINPDKSCAGRFELVKGSAKADDLDCDNCYADRTNCDFCYAKLRLQR